jgi:hypothetical protein
MDKETRTVVLALGVPLVTALCGWMNSCAEASKTEVKLERMSDDFQDYIEYVMKQRGCEP